MAGRGLSLKAYLAATRGPLAEPLLDLPARPPGPLLWAWAHGAERGRALSNLCARLQGQNPDIAVTVSGSAPPLGPMVQLPTPPERTTACTAFARHVHPEVVLWAGRELAPALLNSLSETGAHLIGIDFDETPPTVPEASRLLPDPAPAALTLFDTLHATSKPAARMLRRLGVDSSRVRASAPLLDTPTPLPCPDALHEEVAQELGGRPVWLAAYARCAEANSLLAAHRQAVRLNHRLLLIIAPASAQDAKSIAKIAAESHLRLCDWDAGEMPDDSTQVLLASGPEDMGLWYRLAPVAFLGGSLCQSYGGQDPFEAAALGTAILYGPNVGAHLIAYSRLVEAGAARIVRDAESLATAVSHVAAPDQAAAMAHAGWDVLSSGADLVDGVIEEVTSVLDARANA